MTQPVSPFAKRAIPLIDLTELAPEATPEQIKALCQKAASLPVAVAAVCVRPQFIGLAKDALKGTAIKVATVINFPTATEGTEVKGANIDAAPQVAETQKAVADGADEIDLVFAWKSFTGGDKAGPLAVVEAVKVACGDVRLKVILESGAYHDLAVLRSACDGVIDAGADFLKTSTGFHAQGATPETARVLCEASKAVGKLVSIKVSGGIRTPEQTQQYLDIVADVMGLNWITPDHFRIGASKLVDNLLAPTTSTAQAVGY